MNEVSPYLLIGGLRETYDLNLLRYYGVGAMVQLAERVEHDGIPALYLPVEDGKHLADAVLDQAIAFVRARKSEGTATLIACGLGISRSSAVAISAIKEIEGCSLAEALLQVQSRHPQARPHPVLWQSLCHRYDENIPYLAVIRGNHKSGVI